MYHRLGRVVHLSLRFVNRLSSDVKLANKSNINSERCISSSQKSRETSVDETEESFGGPSELYLGTTEKDHLESKQHKKSKGRFRKQKTKWISQKVDEIRKENESKPEKEVDLTELKTQYHFTEENQFEIMNRELIPLCLIDYETQVKIKTRRLELYLKQFLKLIQGYSSTIILDANGMPCVVHELIRSDLLDEYRSQDEFHIGLGVNKIITVGSMFGNFKAGNLVCISPEKFSVCKKSHRLLAKKFQQYIKEKSQLKVCLDYKASYGNWLSFFVRSNQDGEHQCLVKLNDQNLTEKQFNEERELLVDYFHSISNEIKIRSLSLEILTISRNSETGEKASGKTSVQHLFGNPRLPVKFKENIYEIPVKSTFPLNVQVYEKVIDHLIENLDLTSSQNVTIINPYSGLGLIDLAKPVNMLFVINSSEQGVQDIKQSFSNFGNKVTNKIQFRSGNMTKSLFKILDSNVSEMSVIVKQENLTFQMLNELRENSKVSKIVIISTKPQEALMKFWTHLCLDNKNNISNGNPFNLISTTPVDTHPHSNVYTIVAIFERIIS